MNLVEIRPLLKEKWHGKEGKEDFGQDQSTQVLVDPNTMKYATGLSKEEKEAYEKELGVDLSDSFDPANPHPYWSTRGARLVFPNKTLILDTRKTIDKVKAANYKASPFCANSQKEYNDGVWPNATHVMYDEGEHAELEAKKITKKREAYKLADKLTKNQKVSIVQIMLDISVRKQSNDFVEIKLEEAIEKDLSSFVKLAKADKDSLYLRGLVLEALYKNILTKEGAGIYYMGDLIAHGVDDAVEYFGDPNNQEVKARILAKIK
jgi:hypothetical protein